MKELEFQYKALKDFAKQLMSLGDLQAYFKTLTAAAKIEAQLIQLQRN
jgi:hypothetical protein